MWYCSEKSILSKQINDSIYIYCITGVTDEKNSHWTPLAEQAVKVIYKLSEYPDGICGNIIKSIADKLIQIGKLEQNILTAAGMISQTVKAKY